MKTRTAAEATMGSEPECGGVGVVGAAAGASWEKEAAGLAGMALPWAAAAPGCCWGDGDGFSPRSGGGGASPAKHHRNRNIRHRPVPHGSNREHAKS